MNKSNLLEDMMEYRTKAEMLEMLIKVILNNSRLNFEKKDLRIDTCDSVMDYVKALCPTAYNAKLTELREEEDEKL